mmetsp:Transcript_959/g.1948  ORF Transcript_959/g.1948 Transcript_959/m.1948 type:complete len:205 (-) Transcript_959:1307-1921(-)
MKATVNCVDNVITCNWDSHVAEFVADLFDGGFPGRIIVEFLEETTVVLLRSFFGPRPKSNCHQRLEFLEIDLSPVSVANYESHQPHRLSPLVWMHTHRIQNTLQFVHIDRARIILIEKLETLLDCLLPAWCELFTEIQDQLVELCIVQPLSLPVLDTILLGAGVLGNPGVQQSDPKHCQGVFHLVMLGLVNYLADGVNIFHVLH